MKLSLFVLSGLLAFAAADSTTESASATASLSPEASCATKCTPTDICCTAQCYKVPCPNDAMANDTTACAAACPQGSGTASDTEKYAQCQQSCFSSLFFPATVSSTQQATAATATGSAYTATGTQAQATDSSSSSKSKSSSATSSASSSKSTSNAASQIQLGVSAAGIMAVVAAAMAL